MIILRKPYGQTSNIFFQHIHIDSYCRELGVKFINPFLDEYYDIYPNLRNEYGHHNTYFYNILRALRIIPNLKFDNPGAQESYMKSIKYHKLAYCQGWYFRSKTPALYRKLYQYLFTPNIKIDELTDKYLNKQTGIEKIIGVHIRRGDYRDFLGGKYFFDDEVYMNMIEQALSIIGKPSKILIFTNDDNLNLFKYTSRFENVIVSNNSVEVDHFLMSSCDLIIGPPSTFSMWASYIGEKQYCHFDNAKAIIKKENISICDGLH
jgi:hypothetical protein